MLDEKKKWFLLNSGGGAQASTPPSFLWANGWSETRVDAGLVKVGADSYDFQISDDAGFSNIVAETLASVSELTTFTGLTPETDYYVRCRAKFGSVFSDWLSTSCYTLSTPLHAYDFRGIKRDTTNVYGKTGAPNGVLSVAEVYSYRGTPNKLTNNGTIGAINGRLTSPIFNNNQSAYTTFSNGQYYKPDTAIDLGIAPFTILYEFQTNNLPAGIFKRILTNSSDTNTWIEITQASIRARFGLGSAGQYTQNFPSTLDAYALLRMIIKRTISGANATVTVGLMNLDDDSISWSVGVTNSDLKNNAIFDLLFANESLYWSSILNFYTKELTDTQIKREFKRAEQPTYTFRANNKSLMPTGVTWEELSAGDYYINNLVYGATGSSSWIAVSTIGNQSAVRLAQNDALVTDFLKIYNHSDGKVTNDISVGAIPGQIYDNHNLGSVFLADNTWFHLEMDNHYEWVETNILVKRFGDNFNMAEPTLLPSGNGIPSYRGSNVQYLQAVKTPTSVIILAQEFVGFARWLTAFVFQDNFNSCQKVRIIDTGGSPSPPTWFYPGLIYMEGETCAVLAQYIDQSGSQRYINSFLLLSDDDFGSIRNLGNTWSKAMTNNAPVTPAEATTNCIAGTDGTSKTYSRIVTSMFHDPDTNKFYGVETNGDLTGLNFIIDDGAGGWTIRAIDVLGEAVEFGYTTKDGVGHGQCSSQMIRTGSNSYDLYAFVNVNGGVYPNKIYKIVRFRTSDSWVTTDSVVDITTDNANLHDRIAVSHNLHYTGGSNAYNGKKLLVCSREFTTPSSHSDTKFVDIS